jgi:RND family efflux transporter MFP subunit
MVVQVADPALRDAVVDAPDAAAAGLRLGDAFEVAAQLDPDVRAKGKVREIAPQADAATRTRRIKIALDHPPTSFRLGSTITAWPAEGVRRAVWLPASAVLMKDGKPFVWIVDAATQKVATKPVTLAGGASDPVEVTAGLEPDMRVVTAGVHSLSEGQQVRTESQATP